MIRDIFKKYKCYNKHTNISDIYLRQSSVKDASMEEVIEGLLLSSVTTHRRRWVL